MKARLAIFASGSGTNAEAIIRFFQHHPAIQVALVLTNNPMAGVIQKAKNLNVPVAVFSKDDFKTESFLKKLANDQITHIALAGFLWLIPSYLVAAFQNRIINIHPALLPKFGGKGMFGKHVHEAVKKSGDSISGITIHAVNEHYDEGSIIFQTSCIIDSNDTVEDIARKVQALEHKHYPAVIEQWIIKSETF